MTTRTSVLAQFKSPDSNSIAAFTCPAGETVIVKSAQIWNASGASLSAHLYLLEALSGVESHLFDGTLLSSTGSDWAGWRVLKPTDRIYFQPGGALLHLWISGTRLIGVAA